MSMTKKDIDDCCQWHETFSLLLILGSNKLERFVHGKVVLASPMFSSKDDFVLAPSLSCKYLKYL